MPIMPVKAISILTKVSVGREPHINTPKAKLSSNKFPESIRSFGKATSAALNVPPW